MKKLLPILLFCLSINSYAQIADGSTAPNFNVQDINGNSHSLYDYLDAGYFVLIDISATWCPPCWSYHNGHHLQTIWENHGPAGEPGVNPNTTDDVVVLFIEGDGNTGINHLNGTATSGTLGNWLEGVDYPIIDDAQIATLFQISGYPTLLTICQDRTVYETGQIQANEYYDEIAGLNCLGLVEGKNLGVKYNGETSICGDFDIEVEVQNLGTESVDNFSVTLFVEGEEEATENYNNNLTSFEKVNIDFGTFNFEESTDISIKINESDNLASDNELNQVINVGKITQQAIVKVTTDNFGSECTWRIKNEMGYVVASGGPYEDHSVTNSFVLQEQEDEEIFIEELGCHSIEVEDSYGDGMYNYEPTFIRIVDLQGNIIVNIDGDEYSSSISKAFSVDNSTTIAENSNSYFNIHPNPVNEKLNIYFSPLFDSEKTTVFVTNMLGEKVIELSNLNTKSIDISSLKNGIYFLNTNLNGKITTEKFVVLK